MEASTAAPPEDPPDPGEMWIWFRVAWAWMYKLKEDTVPKLLTELNRLQRDVAAAIGDGASEYQTLQLLEARVSVLEKAYQRSIGFWIALGLIGPVLGSIAGGLILYAMTGKKP